MSGVHGALIGHLARRGFEAAQNQFKGPSAEEMSKLQQDAQLYENAGPDMAVEPWELLPVIITGLVTLVLIASIRYTVGEVMASLAMIESPSKIAIVEAKPAAYKTGEPDAPLEKESFMAEEGTDLEITVVAHKPITTRITSTIGHLNRVGGSFARWRGIRSAFLYHFVHTAATNLVSGGLGFGLFGHALVYIFVSVCTSRLHAVWTHGMIAYPSSKPFFRRFVDRKSAKALLLPSAVFAAAQQATIILPVAVAFSLGAHELNHEDILNAAHGKDCAKMAIMGLRFLAVPITALFVAFAVLLPAAVTLTRIEATLLPDGEETIVPFDRAAILGDIDITARGGSRALFVQSWRSFDTAARWRLIKVYGNMALVQAAVALIGIHLAIAEIFVIGGDRLAILLKSAGARLKLMAIEALQNGPQ
ncbi:hypothetical protein Tdes44962_MAKER01778 [Teratosphaeria destructans]|uniref:Uncharacterized protein n=1 Tax=Teratosphaeria destructans TaxID=418781 RepID=A0A9W7SXL2_9PEZI|nr:hypothetical protein Tdes44962_MAKER01778 [Teratosphaeria destructans]